jgi:PIN domain nuclease of toxin-antitoxin system
VRLLLDTHIALWALSNSRNLSEFARTLIADPENEIFVSLAAVWEIAIKHAVVRAQDPVPMSGKEAFEAFREAGYGVIDILPAHVLALEALPALYGDPFDRIMVAQALSTPLRLLTHDRTVAAYSDTIILA